LLRYEIFRKNVIRLNELLKSRVKRNLHNESANRDISVDSRGMLEVMGMMFDATALVAELTVEMK